MRSLPRQTMVDTPPSVPINESLP